MDEENLKKENLADKPESKGLLYSYADDLGHSVAGEKGATIGQAIAQEKMEEAKQESRTLASTKNKILFIGSIALIIAGILSIVILWPKNQTVIIPPKSQELAPLIFSDSNQEINITGLSKEKVIQAVQNEITSKQMLSDKIENISLIEAVGGQKYLAGTKTFLQAIQSQAPAGLIQTLDQKFMTGIHSSAGNQPFIIFKTNSYSDAKLGMADWEGRLFDDVYGLFNIDVSGTNISLFEKKFEDAVVENKDTRAIKDDSGKIILMYSFLNDQTIAITTSPATMAELYNRLVAQKVAQ